MKQTQTIGLFTFFLIVQALSFSAQADTFLQMTGSITAGTQLSASVLMIATNDSIFCKMKDEGGWPTQKTTGAEVAVTIANGTYTFQSDIKSGFCAYQAKGIEITITTPGSPANFETISIDSPLSGTAGYDDITNVSSLVCQAHSSTSSSSGTQCAVVKKDGTSSATDQITISNSELSGPIKLDILGK